MPEWVLINAAENKVVDAFQAGPKDYPELGDNWSVKVQTLRGGKRDGVMLVEINNGACTFQVCPTRGMGLWKATSKDVQYGWQSPIAGPVHPAFVPVSDSSGLGWLDGFDELMCRCGMQSNGAPEFDATTGRLAYPLHGRMANIPAHKVVLNIDPATKTISVAGEVDESRFHFQKTRLTAIYSTKIGEPSLKIKDAISNLSALPADVELLYHTNFGLPLLDAGSRIVAPVKTLVPRDARAVEGIKTWDSYAAEEPSYTEQVYFFDLLADDTGKTEVMLKNAHGSAGASLVYNTKQLPCFTLWKDTASAADGYVTGLEPGLNFPNPFSFEKENKRVVSLGGGKRLDFELDLNFLTDSAAVSAAEKRIADLQKRAAPKIYDAPQKGWTKV